MAVFGTRPPALLCATLRRCEGSADRVPTPNDPAPEHMQPQPAPADQRLQDARPGKLLQVAARRAVPHALTERLAHPDAAADQGEQLDPAHHQIATALARASGQPEL